MENYLFFLLRFDGVAVDLLSRLLKFQSKDRISAVDGMRHPYFYSLGQRVHHLPHSKSQAMHVTLLHLYVCMHVRMYVCMSCMYVFLYVCMYAYMHRSGQCTHAVHTFLQLFQSFLCRNVNCCLILETVIHLK